MKRIAVILLTLALLLAATTALAATPVPMSTAEIPAIPAAPAAPRVVRAVQSGATASITFDRDLPREMLLEFVALNGQGRETAVRYGQEGRARYNIAGGLTQLTRFDEDFNEFVYTADGAFSEFRDENSGVWTRFDENGAAALYSYEAQGMRVWFDMAATSAGPPIPTASMPSPGSPARAGSLTRPWASCPSASTLTPAASDRW